MSNLTSNLDVFGGITHHESLVNTVLPTRIKNINNVNIPLDSVIKIDNSNQVTALPITATGQSLLNTVSIADLRATILENDTEEAIRLIADNLNEINFYTNGTTATELRMQITDTGTLINNNVTMKGQQSHKEITSPAAYPLLLSASSYQANLYGPSGGAGYLVERAIINSAPTYKFSAYESAYRNIETNSTFDFFGSNDSPITLHRGTDPITVVGDIDKTQISLYYTKSGTTSHTYGHYITTSHDINDTSLDNNRIDFFTNAGGENGTLSNAQRGLSIVNGHVETPGQVISNGVISTGAVQMNVFSSIGAGAGSHVTIGSHLRPNADSTLDLGSNSHKFRDLYIDQGEVGGVAITSDKRFKKDIKKLNKGLSFINKLNPVEFKYKTGNRIHFGFIAQEVKEILNTDQYSLWGISRSSDKQFLQPFELISPIVKSIQDLYKLVQSSSTSSSTNSSTNSEETNSRWFYDNSVEIDEQKEEINNLSVIIHNQNEDIEKLKIKNNDLENEVEGIEISNRLLIQENLNLKTKVENLENQVNEILEFINNRKEENKQEQHREQHKEDEIELSEGNFDMMENLQERMYSVENRVNKLDVKQKKHTTILNKLLKLTK